MTIAEIIEIETQRKEPEQYGLVHFIKEQNGFYRAHDWSAWLMSTFPFGEAKNNPMAITARRMKDGYIDAWVGFPLTSLGKYIPDDGSVQFLPVNDNQIDVKIDLPEDVLNADYESVRGHVDEWKAKQPINEGKKQRREDREVSESAPRVIRISDVISRIISFPLESKSPIEAWEFLRKLRQQVAELY